MITKNNLLKSFKIFQISISLCLCASVVLLYSQVSPVRVFTLKDSISTAINNRKEMILAQKEREIAKEKIREAYSALYPKIDFLFNYSRLYTDKYMVFPPVFESLFIPRRSPGDYYLTRVSLWKHIYSGGRESSNIKLAKMNLDRAESHLKVVKNNLSYEVKKSIYKLVACERKLEVYNVVISSMEAIIKQSKDKRQTEMKDILQAVKNDYSIQTNEYDLLKLSFLDTVGVELDTNFVTKVDFEPVVEHYDLNKLLVWSFEYRPEPEQIQAEEEIDALTVKLSLAARYPTVSLGGYYEFSGEQISLENRNWVATLNLNLPIFDGWASWSRIKQKRLQHEQQKLRRKDVEDSIRFEVRKAFIEYNFYLRELEEKSKLLKDAELRLIDISKKDDYTKLLLLKSYLKSKLNYLDTVKENLISHSYLEYAIGKELAE